MHVFGTFIRPAALLLSLSDAVILVLAIAAVSALPGELWGLSAMATAVLPEGLPETLPAVAALPPGWPYIAAAGAVLVLAMYATGVYEREVQVSLRRLGLRMSLALVVGSAAAYAVMLASAAPQMAPELPIAVAFAAPVMLGWRAAMQGAWREHANPPTTLVLGAGSKAQSLMRSLPAQVAARSLIGFLPASSDSEAPGKGVARDFVLKRNGNLSDLARELGAREIVIALDDRRRCFPVAELLDCRMRGIRVLDEVTYLERETGRVNLDNLYPSWLIFAEGFRRGLVTDWIKRTLDVTAALGILTFTLPLTLLTALLIKIDSRGPVFYRQERVGKDGVRFNLLKFRSMRTDAEAGGAVWAQKRDPRVTRVGSLIRKTRIDEIPQAINVLRGDMSFVGPRPERPMFVEKLSAEIPYYAERHRMKPGITGWAQVKYPYGASVEDARAKLTYDLYYMKHHNLLLDLLILVQTVRVVLLAEGAR
jgi:sugar transferase (PEP-CTERM system associated)